MIGYIKGKVAAKDEEAVLVETGGVGYRLFVSDAFLEEVEEGDEAELFVWTHLRQNALDLYGCTSQAELAFFRLLEGMSGIGPKIALSLVAYGSPEALKREIEEKGGRFAQEVKGVGQKKLKQLLLELTGKVEELKKTGLSSTQEEAVSALKSLGFKVREAEKMVKKIGSEEDPEKMVEEALKHAGKKADS